MSRCWVPACWMALLLSGCSGRTTDELFQEGKLLLQTLETHKKSSGAYPAALKDIAPELDRLNISWKSWHYSLEDGKPVLYAGPRDRTVCFRIRFGWHVLNTDPGGPQERTPLR